MARSLEITSNDVYNLPNMRKPKIDIYEALRIYLDFLLELGLDFAVSDFHDISYSLLKSHKRLKVCLKANGSVKPHFDIDLVVIKFRDIDIGWFIRSKVYKVAYTTNPELVYQMYDYLKSLISTSNIHHHSIITGEKILPIDKFLNNSSIDISRLFRKVNIRATQNGR